jgi:signal transduction histidine kinase
VRFEYYIDERVNTIERSIQISFYRMISELIKNIQTHSGATVATIQLIPHESYILLQVEDNGKGFISTSAHGIGLKSIQSRVKFHQGILTIDSGRLNTTIHIEIPVTYA